MSGALQTVLPTPIPGPVTITVGAASMRQEFNGCDPDYIANVCHARCCNPRTMPPLAVVHDDEVPALTARGARVEAGLLVPLLGDDGRQHCQFNDPATYLCTLHFTPDKPSQCIVSPFILSPTGRRLMVKNYFRRLPCYRDGARLPAYVAFRSGLDRLLGADESARLCAHLDAGGGDLKVALTPLAYHRLQLTAERRYAGWKGATT